MRLQKNLYGVICAVLLLNGCAGMMDKLTSRLEDTSIKGEVISSVQSGAENAPQRFVIINGSYGDTLEEKHLLQQSKNPVTKLTYLQFNTDKAYVQQMLSDAGWEEVSPEQFLQDKSNVTIISMYSTTWLHKKAPDLPPIFTAGEKTKMIAKDVGKGIGKNLLKNAAGLDSEEEPLQEGDPVDAYYYLVIGAFKTTHGNDSAQRPTELYWKTTSFLKATIAYGEEEYRENYQRFMPVLATMAEPHIGKNTGGKIKTEWPNQEIAKFKNEPRFYENYKCDAFLFFPDLKDIKASKISLLSQTQVNLERTIALQEKNKLLASFLAQQKANLQQDVWDYEYGIATVSELITQKCS